MQYCSSPPFLRDEARGTHLLLIVTNPSGLADTWGKQEGIFTELAAIKKRLYNATVWLVGVAQAQGPESYVARERCHSRPRAGSGSLFI